MLKFLQTRLHPLKRSFAIGVLRSALSSGYGETGGAMNQAHACFNFIAMLPAWPSGDEELNVAVAFERFTVGWI